MVEASDGFSIRVVNGLGEVLALESQWRDLEGRSPAHYLTEQFDWIAAGLRHQSPKRRGNPVCITAWRDDRLVGAWAFTIKSEWGARIARRIGCGSDEDYGHPLLDASLDGAKACDAMLSALAGIADVLVLPAIKIDHPAYDAVSRFPWKLLRAWEAEAIVIDAQSLASWDAFSASLSGKLRSSIKYETGRAGREIGPVTFRCPETSADTAAALDFFLTHKKKFLEAIGSRHWFQTAEARQFIAEQAASPDDNRLRLFVLSAGEIPMAAAICFCDDARSVFFATTYDAAYSKYSPGRLLLDGCIRFASETGRAFDFGMVVHSYKERWGGAPVKCRSVSVAATRRGQLYIAARRVWSIGVNRTYKLLNYARRLASAKA